MIELLGYDNIKFITFSDGSETCELNDYRIEGDIRVTCIIEDCNRDLLRLGLVKDALDRLGTVSKVQLYLPYVPQARADRVFGHGMPLPIKLFCDILNSFGFDEVTISDPHSDVTPALINNVQVVSQTNCLLNKIPQIRNKMPEFTLVAPDLGSLKKIFDSVQMMKHEDYIQAIKIRDVSTGNIIKCDVINDDISGNVLIVDDISDGGTSFKFLAQKLKNKGAGKVGLFVTHGIFSKGLKELEKDIDFIWCSNIIGNYINGEDIWRFNER